MDVDKLIDLVAARKPVWDMKHPKHQKKHVIDKCWREISEEMKEDEYKLRKKWKYLRDQFPVELGKTLIQKIDGDSRGSKWPYFNTLMFLKDSVKPRKNCYRTTGSNKQNTDTNEDSSEKDFPDALEGSVVDQDVKSKLEEDDEHLHFFKSLLPHVRKIPAHKLLSFRNSVQEIVEDYAYQQPGSMAVCHSQSESPEPSSPAVKIETSSP